MHKRVLLSREILIISHSMRLRESDKVIFIYLQRSTFLGPNESISINCYRLLFKVYTGSEETIYNFQSVN